MSPWTWRSFPDVSIPHWKISPFRRRFGANRPRGQTHPATWLGKTTAFRSCICTFTPCRLLSVIGKIPCWPEGMRKAELLCLILVFAKGHASRDGCTISLFSLGPGWHKNPISSRRDRRFSSPLLEMSSNISASSHGGSGPLYHFEMRLPSSRFGASWGNDNFLLIFQFQERRPLCHGNIFLNCFLIVSCPLPLGKLALGWEPAKVWSINARRSFEIRFFLEAVPDIKLGIIQQFCASGEMWMRP